MRLRSLRLVGFFVLGVATVTVPRAASGQTSADEGRAREEQRLRQQAAEEDRAKALQMERQRVQDAKNAQQEDRARVEREEAARRVLTPLSVQVVVSRYQGEKRISNTPYTLAVNAVAARAGSDGRPAQLRMGAKVPVPAVAAAKDSGTVYPPAQVNYQDIGTNIDCSARATDDGRFQLVITVDDTSVYTNIADAGVPTVGNMPVFRSFRSTNTLILRDGQARQFTAATDRVSGEVVRIDVTLTVVK